MGISSFASIGLAALVAMGRQSPLKAQGMESRMYPRQGDYSFMWWANGWWWGTDWLGRSPDGRRLLAVQAGRTGLVLDVERMEAPHLGLLSDLPPYEQAGAWVQQAVTGLPAGHLVLSIRAAGTTYTCRSAAGGDWGGDYTNCPLSLIESGRFFNRYRIGRLVFANDAGGQLPVEANLEVLAWPDELTLRLTATPREDLPDASVHVALWGQDIDAASEDEPAPWPAGRTRQVELTLVAGGDGLAQRKEPAATVRLRVAQIEGGQAVQTEWDPLLRCQAIPVPLPEAGPARLKVELENPSDAPATARLVFQRLRHKVGGVIGACPVIRGLDGQPLGLAVQISKNWHRDPNHRLADEGPWLRFFTLVQLPPHERAGFEFTLLAGWWGSLPSVSHAQLCLIGYGVNQRWDQVAIGDWGETITYDPEINLSRAIIDDVRPLLVTSMGRQREYSWTNNVGGGDFLVYVASEGGRQVRRNLVGMRATYELIGPNLTRAAYHGATADGAIAAAIEVSTPRADDIARHYHHFRYDVLRPTDFTRLAFYQLGADNYNDHTFERLAVGNASGLMEEWCPVKGGLNYSRVCVPLTGDAPWVSLHRADGTRDRGGAWANRGMVVRSWRARLGGKDVPIPCISVYGSENGPASALVELSPPAGLTKLEPGDFVEATVELLTLPQHAEDYYGPNRPLRQALAEHPDSWQQVHRQAAGNHLDVSVHTGRLVEAYPPIVEVNTEQQVRLEIAGGVGYVPVTFTGLTSPGGYELYLTADGRRAPLDQSKLGSDFWQVDRRPDGSFSRTYTLPLDRDDPSSPIQVELIAISGR